MTTLMTAQEVMEVLRISPPTLTRLVRAGEIPGFKLGGRYRFDRSAIEQIAVNR